MYLCVVYQRTRLIALPFCLLLTVGCLTATGAVAESERIVFYPQSSSDQADAISPDARVDQCDGLQTGRDPLGQTVHRKPLSYRQRFFDSRYATTIERVSGNPGTVIADMPDVDDDPAYWSDTPRHKYSSHQAWSADGRLLDLFLGRVLLDATNFKPLHTNRPPAGSMYHLSPTSSDRIFVVDKTDQARVVSAWNPRNLKLTPLFELPDHHGLAFNTRTSPSYDGQVLGIKAIQNDSGEQVCLLVDLKEKKISHSVSFDKYEFKTGKSKFRRCFTSASGKFMIVDGHKKSQQNNNAMFFDWHGNQIGRLPANDDVECTAGHADFGIDPGGDDVMVGVCKRGKGDLSKKFGGNTIAYRIRDGHITVVGPPMGHTSCRNSARPGWCFGSSFGRETSEIVALKLDGSRIEHIANTYTDGGKSPYLSEPHAVPSPDGTKVVFASDWNGHLDHAATFVVDFGEACSAAR